MTKAELVTAIAENAELNKKQASNALNAFLLVVRDALIKNEKVQITGFGSFETRTRAARTGRNPRNPEDTVEIPERRVPVFKAGSDLKNAVK